MSNIEIKEKENLKQKILQDKKKLESNLQNLQLVEKDVRNEIQRITSEKEKYTEWSRYFGDKTKAKEVIAWYDQELDKLEAKLQRISTMRERVLMVQKKLENRISVTIKEKEVFTEEKQLPEKPTEVVPESKSFKKIEKPKPDKLPEDEGLGLKRKRAREILASEAGLEELESPVIPQRKQTEAEIKLTEKEEVALTPAPEKEQPPEKLNELSFQEQKSQEVLLQQPELPADWAFEKPIPTVEEKQALKRESSELTTPTKKEEDSYFPRPFREQEIREIETPESKSEPQIKPEKVATVPESSPSKEPLQASKEDKPEELPQREPVRTVPEKVSEVDSKVLYLGIDLGTCETTVWASNGVNATILSAVGWPKDVISRRLVGKEVLFGEEALRNRSALYLYRPLERGVIKNTDEDLMAARELIKYVISLAKPSQYKKVYAIIGAPAQASLTNRQAIMDAARELIDAVAIISEPFAVAYGVGMIYNSLVIDIGAGTVDLCCLKGTLPGPEDQITLFKAGDFIDLQIMEILKTKIKGAQVTKELARKWKEENSFVMETDQRAVVEITVEGRPLRIDISQVIKTSCEAIVPDIVAGVKKLVASFDPEFQSELKQNILLAGGGSLIRNLDRLIASRLRYLGEVRVFRVKEPIVAGAKGALALAKDVNTDFWQLFY